MLGGRIHLAKGKPMHKERLVLLVSLILAAAFARLLPHPVNMTPVPAIALFAGAYLPRKLYAFIIPVAAMFISDLVIGFHSTIPYVYAAMLLTVVLGFGLKGKVGFLNVAGATLVASVLFFVITNFGTWLVGGLYPLTKGGFVQCFTLALPFFTNTILGDFLFAAILFGVFSFAETRFPKLRAV